MCFARSRVLWLHAGILYDAGAFHVDCHLGTKSFIQDSMPCCPGTQRGAVSVQATALPRIWQHKLETMRGASLQHAVLRRSLQCSASAADASLAAPSSNGALSNIIDTELKAEAEQSYLAVRSVGMNSPNSRQCYSGRHF